MRFARCIIKGQALHKPLSLQTDGDLWTAFSDAVRAKDLQAVKVSWTKGHTTLRALREGLVSTRAAVANSIADRAANLGSKDAIITAKRQILDYFAMNQEAYMKLFAAIHRRIARVAIRTAELREAAAKAKESGTSVLSFVPTPQPSTHPSTNYITIRLVAPPPIQGDEHQRIVQYQLRIFWTRLYVTPTAAPQEPAITEHGTTWLELFLLFTIKGGKVSKEQFQGVTTIQPRFTPLFKTFVRLSKSLLEFATHGDRALFNPVLTRARPLLKYGITTFMAMISARIAIQSGVAAGLPQALCAIGGRITSSSDLPSKLRVGTFRPLQICPWARQQVDDNLDKTAKRRMAAEY